MRLESRVPQVIARRSVRKRTGVENRQHGARSSSGYSLLGWPGAVGGRPARQTLFVALHDPVLDALRGLPGSRAIHREVALLRQNHAVQRGDAHIGLPRTRRPVFSQVTIAASLCMRRTARALHCEAAPRGRRPQKGRLSGMSPFCEAVLLTTMPAPWALSEEVIGHPGTAFAFLSGALGQHTPIAALASGGLDASCRSRSQCGRPSGRWSRARLQIRTSHL